MLKRGPVILSSAVLCIACAAILAVALARGHEAKFVAMLLAVALASWVYALVKIFQGARIRDHQIKIVTSTMPGSSANVFARVFGFRNYPALAQFQYLIAPWFAGAGVVVGVGLAAVVAMAK
jgi:hypothetical protein